MMDFIKHIGILVLCTTIGNVIGVSIGVAAYYGLFVRWEVIGTPPEKVIEIITLDYFKSETGHIYHISYANSECRENGCLEKVNEVSRDDAHNIMIYKFEACDPSLFLPFTNGFVTHKEFCLGWGDGVITVVQAIDNNGTIYEWKHGFDIIEILNALIYMAIGTTIGFVFGMWRSFFYKEKSAKNVAQQSVHWTCGYGAAFRAFSASQAFFCLSSESASRPQAQ